MKEPPNRADLAQIERIARRTLTKSQDQELRKMCKGLLDLTNQLDQYVESLYPGFALLEAEVRDNRCALALESDGVWRLRNPEGKPIITGVSLKDLLVNLILWDSSWVADEDFDEESKSEDDIFSPDRRKTPRSTV